MNILIVDDEPDILETTGMLLEMDGHHVDLCSDWEDALAMDLSGVDVVLQDLRMPGMNIKEYVQKLRKKAELRVVLFTADRILDADAAAMDVDGMLSKPFAVEALRSALHASELDQSATG